MSDDDGAHRADSGGRSGAGGEGGAGGVHLGHAGNRGHLPQPVRHRLRLHLHHALTGAATVATAATTVT